VRYDFEVNEKPVLVVAPREPAAGKPWVWHGEFFGHKPAPDIALLGKGFHIVYTRVPDQFGGPTAVAHWNEVYKVLTEQHGFSKKAALVGVSRGGLYCYNWAAQNPDKVACIYGDAPVCDVKSWPMGKGHGVGSPAEVEKLLRAYEVKTEDELFAKLLNPIDSLKPLAEAHVPLLHVYGDADEVVPWDENTKIIADRYKALGGEIVLIAKPGIGHVHGLDDSTPIIEFIESHCVPSATAGMPK
jgi:pimeloyl-ACP methyl ester carboxylesterase